jgi:transcriptional regulator with XRE-family HTH domain
MAPKIIPSEEGKRIRALREKLGIDRYEFWELTGMSSSTLKKLESGASKVTISKARLISTLFIYRLGMSFEEASEDMILYGKNKEKPKGKAILE